MAGVINTTARQYNIKCVNHDNGHRVTVRVAPGFNIVDDKHWDVCKKDKYVLSLKKEGHIKFGEDEDDMLMEKDADTVCKSKSVPPTGTHGQQGQDGDDAKPPIP